MSPIALSSSETLAADTPSPHGERHRRAALRRLLHDKVAIGSVIVFALIVIACLCAPLYAKYVAGTGPNDNHVTEVIRVGGRPTDVVSTSGIPIGPTWQSKFLLGADSNGRDVAVRLLYGGRTSLMIGFLAAAITLTFGTLTGILAGFFRGWTDTVLSRALDVIWAYPVVLLGIALGTALELGGLKLGPLVISGNSLFVPALIIGFVFIPYLARPIRTQVLLLREREFVAAARLLGKGSMSIIVSEVLPNVTSAVVVFVPLIVANAILLEAGLSYLGAGVQAPNPSWGTMIASGVALITSTPSLLFAPVIMLVATTVSMNLFGESLRNAIGTTTSMAGR